MSIAEIRREIVAEARTWLGVRFRHQGRTREGVDCAGLVICVGREVGVLPADLDVTGYTRRPDGVSLLASCREHLEEIARHRVQPGDVVVFRIEHDPQHLALVGNYGSGELSLIHSYATVRKVTENRLDGWWDHRLVGAFRFPGLA